MEGNEHIHLIGDHGIINGYIQHELSAGHSPFHQVFWIREDNDVVFFGGDEAPQLQQMKTRFIAKYDHDGKKASDYAAQRNDPAMLAILGATGPELR